jgi:hypothetical protein
MKKTLAVRPDYEKCVPKAQIAYYNGEDIRIVKFKIIDIRIEVKELKIYYKEPLPEGYDNMWLWIKRDDEGGEFGILRQTGKNVEREFEFIKE